MSSFQTFHVTLRSTYRQKMYFKRLEHLNMFPPQSITFHKALEYSHRNEEKT